MEENMMNGKGRKANQRMQHFLVLQYLLEHTDENHYVGADDLVEYLKSKCEIYSENRSIYKDIREINIAYLMIEEDVTHQEAVEMLNEDPDRATVKYKKKNGYYIANRSIAPADARLLVEALHTARFVTKRDTEYIADSVGKLLSEHQRERIKHDTFAVAREKTNNVQLFDNVDLIHSAMAEYKEGKRHEPEKIRFKYLKCTIQNPTQRVERRRGSDYIVSPHAIMINEGNYYLLGIDDKSKRLLTYRIDRMINVKFTGEMREGNELTRNLQEYLDTYSKRVFSMYTGRRELVRIRFTNDLLDSTVDRFGNYASYLTEDNWHFTVAVSVEISPMFFGWLSVFANKAKILSPSSVIEEYEKHLSKIQDLYHR
jgi:predicted DNA-binding transcriptional regulator YafY